MDNFTGNRLHGYETSLEHGICHTIKLFMMLRYENILRNLPPYMLFSFVQKKIVNNNKKYNSIYF